MKNFKYYILLTLFATIACNYSTSVKAAANPIKPTSENCTQTLSDISKLIDKISLDDAKSIYLTIMEKSLS